MITVTKRFRWTMGHRLTHGYEGPCTNLHGHDYSVEVTMGSSSLNAHGMVIDFKEISRLMKGWIDQNWDHGFLIHKDDTQLLNFLMLGDQSKHYIVDWNTTAENIAHFLYWKFQAELHALADDIEERGLRIIKIRVYETPDSWAELAEGGVS